MGLEIKADLLYTSEQVAEFLQANRRTVQKWLKAGVVPGAFKLGGGRRGRWYVYGRDLLTLNKLGELEEEQA